MAQGAARKVKKRKPSVLKRARQSRERAAVNRANRTEVRTIVKQMRAALNAGDVKAANDMFRPTLSALDHAIAKGVLAENTANRYKSRISIAMNHLKTAKKA